MYVLCMYVRVIKINAEVVICLEESKRHMGGFGGKNRMAEIMIML